MGTKQYTINYLFQTALLKETCWKKKKKKWEKIWPLYIYITFHIIYNTYNRRAPSNVQAFLRPADTINCQGPNVFYYWKLA